MINEQLLQFQWLNNCERFTLSIYCIVHNIELFTLLEEMTGYFQHLVIAINEYT